MGGPCGRPFCYPQTSCEALHKGSPSPRTSRAEIFQPRPLQAHFYPQMTLSLFLLLTLAALLLTSGGSFLHALQHAIEGYEDEAGFHFGPTPAALFLFPAPTTSPAPFLPDNSERAMMSQETKPEGRQILGSKPPMLPADLQAEDLKPSSGNSIESPAKPENP
jgi:hypothetical protein